jgi:hypothetical protein
MNLPSTDSARMMVTRAIVRMSKLMRPREIPRS